MKIFPEKEYTFKLLSSQEDTLDRLNRRTEYSGYLSSYWTEKSFRGEIKKNYFKIISSKVGSGAFCTLEGEININDGFVKIKVHRVFKILLSILLLFPIIGIIISLTIGGESFELLMIPSIIGQLLIIRFIAISYIFSRNSKESLRRLRDVLDVEIMNFP